MSKRILLFFITNLLVVSLVTIILSILGVSSDSISGLALLCFIYGIVGAFISLFISKWVAKRFYKVKIIKQTNKNTKKIALFNMVKQVSQEANIQMPEVGLYNSSDPNAFATGPNQNNSLVAFSSELLEQLNEKELEGVIGHEISHIKNGDMVTMTILTGIANAFVMFLSRIVATIIVEYFTDEDSTIGYWGYFLVVMALQTAFMLLAYIPINSFSRHREYRADAGAAKLTSPQQMINALKTIEKISMNAKSSRQDGYEFAKINSKSKIMLFSTHPSIEDRINALQNLN